MPNQSVSKHPGNLTLVALLNTLLVKCQTFLNVLTLDIHRWCGFLANNTNERKTWYLPTIQNSCCCHLETIIWFEPSKTIERGNRIVHTEWNKLANRPVSRSSSWMPAWLRRRRNWSPRCSAWRRRCRSRSPNWNCLWTLPTRTTSTYRRPSRSNRSLWP